MVGCIFQKFDQIYYKLTLLFPKTSNKVQQTLELVSTDGQVHRCKNRTDI